MNSELALNQNILVKRFKIRKHLYSFLNKDAFGVFWNSNLFYTTCSTFIRFLILFFVVYEVHFKNCMDKTGNFQVNYKHLF